MARLQHACMVLIAIVAAPLTLSAEALPGTKQLRWEGDLASRMIDGIDLFLLRKLSESPAERMAYWGDTSIPHHEKTVAARKQLAHVLGIRDSRSDTSALQLVSTLRKSSELTRNSDFTVHRVRWKAVGEIHGEGLLFEPHRTAAANLILLPDANQTPESVANQGYAARFSAAGCRVVIPALVSRTVVKRRRSELTNREYLYRSSFELGRQLVGYEIQKVLALVDWFEEPSEPSELPITTGVAGWGEGGRIALYADALDDRIGPACVSGYFGPREEVWQEPLDRNVYGLLNHLGDAEIASLNTKGRVIIDTSPGPSASVRTMGGAPYVLRPIEYQAVMSEAKRIRNQENIVVVQGDGNDALSDDAAKLLATELGVQLLDSGEQLQLPVDEVREDRGIQEVEQFNSNLLAQSPYTRKQYFEQLDVSSVEAHARTVERYRDDFRTSVIGEFNDELLPLNPRTRKVFDQPKWTGYEVVLDVFPDVFAFGILLLPKDLKSNELRPVVVCQHGLEGRPRDVIENDHRAYHDYAAKLAERGFITFAPQNIYIFRDRFRTLQRKANPLGKTLFSIMVPQHQQIVSWLANLPGVDPDRIAFYGLSYGGKSAMRIPPLVDRYCLSICSADFNDWVWKNASTLSPYSYVWSGEYEIFEWDLGSTFNYSEMATLIAPKPFMVERGHFDGVAPDERVALEFAKVRHLYQAKLGIGDRCAIEFFVGPHTINGKGTFDFLHRHLDWPKSSKEP